MCRLVASRDVDDRSRDATAPLARRWAVRQGVGPLLDVALNRAPVPIGVLRRRAARHVLHRLNTVPPASIRLLSTDADSRVPPAWALRHVELAASGADAVSGGVLPDGPVPPPTSSTQTVSTPPTSASARPHFLELGGFPPCTAARTSAC